VLWTPADRNGEGGPAFTCNGVQVTQRASRRLPFAVGLPPERGGPRGGAAPPANVRLAWS
jgi:hypothetical protein